MSSEQDVSNLLRPPQSSSPFTIIIPPVEDSDVPMRETRKASGSRGGSREVSATLNVRAPRSSRSRSASAVSSEDPLHIDSPDQSADVEVVPVARGDKLNADDEIVKILSIQRSAGMPTMYQVKLENGRRVRVTEEQMASYEDIIQNFEERRPENRRTSRSTAGSLSEVEDFIAGTDEEESDNERLEVNSDSDAAPKRKSRTRSKTKKKPKVKEVVEPTRRSSRAAKPNASYGVEGTSEPDEQPEEESEEEEEAPQTKKATKSNKQVISLKWTGNSKSRAIDVDSDEDEEEEVPVSALLMHRSVCQKCDDPRADVALAQYLARNKKKKKGSKRKRDPDEDEESESDIRAKGCWVECGHCVVSYHFGCLPKTIQADIIRSIKADIVATTQTDGVMDIDGEEAPVVDLSRPVARDHKKELDVTETITLPSCALCLKNHGKTCLVCHSETAPVKVDQPVVESTSPLPVAFSQVSDFQASSQRDETTMRAATLEDANGEEALSPLLFRCAKCKRAAHYPCLPRDDEDEIEQPLELEARFWQQDWQCPDCTTYDQAVDVVLAWRPIRAAGEPELTAEELAAFPRPSHKDTFADVEYLIKFVAQSYCSVIWVPHGFMAAASNAKLRNFLEKGLELPNTEEDDMVPDDKLDLSAFGRAPNPLAKEKIPTDWITYDRILDCTYNTSQGEDIPADSLRKLSDDPSQSIGKLSWCLVKWRSLSYSACTWEQPPVKGDQSYDSFEAAYEAWLSGRKVYIPKLKQEQMDLLDKPRPPSKFEPLETQPDYIAGGKLNLMDFQMEGVNWLRFKHWTKKNGVLSDEMGLGKTVQIISFISYLFRQENAMPFLICVPNSTIGNWVREFAQWAPKDLRVVPYLGDKTSRDLLERYELFTQRGSSKEPLLHAQCVIATFESLEKNLHVFKRVQRYDVVVIDEAQRLKAGDSGGLFRALSALNASQTILLTGTPLNNSIGEILNLMSFLDPAAFANLPELKKKFETLTPQLVQELQELIKPYFLRRTKEMVLNLPPLQEIVIPLSLSSLAREFYKSTLSKNADAMSSLTRQASNGRGKSVKRSNFNNLLMALRKICQSPYLASPDVEPQNVTAAQKHINLIEASSKFAFLARILPKLIASGHRMLIFTQFLSVLDLLERFLEGMKLKFARLDGGTTQSERQEAIDLFNRKDSPLSCFILSTRAGGVGINLTTADTIVLFDQDFNPMQDMQAISRAHRIGQTKPVTCFKLVTKGTCEEKILSAGKRKMVLEHLIVSSLGASGSKDAEEDQPEDVASILAFGAQAIFDDQQVSEIKYSDADLNKLLERTSVVPDAAVGSDGKKEVAKKAFSYAKIWQKESGSLEEEAAEEEPQSNIAEQRSFWDSVLANQQVEEARLAKEKANKLGRGKRARKQIVDLNRKYNDFDSDGSPKKTLSSQVNGDTTEDDTFAGGGGSGAASSDNDDNFALPPEELEDLQKKEPKKKRKKSHIVPPANGVGAENGSAIVDMPGLSGLLPQGHSAPPSWLEQNRRDSTPPLQQGGLDTYFSSPKRPSPHKMFSRQEISAASPKRKKETVAVPASPERLAASDSKEARVKRHELLEKLQKRAARYSAHDLLAQLSKAKSLKGSKQLAALLDCSAAVKLLHEKKKAERSKSNGANVARMQV